MLEKTTIARPYAEAAFEQAQDEDALQSWTDLLSVLAATVSDSGMRALLHNPKVSAAQIVDIVNDVAGSAFSDSQANFVRILVDAERLQFAPEMKTLFDQKRLDAEGLARVEVISAYPLEDAQRERISEAMSRRLSRKIELSESTDEKLIGGAVIRNGDSVIDASIRGQLEELRSELA